MVAIVHKANRLKFDRLRKDKVSLFKDEGLSIAIDMNLIETNFLDVSFNLNTRKYFLFKKSNNTPLYTHSKSSHSLSMVNQLPSMTQEWTSNLSCVRVRSTSKQIMVFFMFSLPSTQTQTNFGPSFKYFQHFGPKSQSVCNELK